MSREAGLGGTCLCSRIKAQQRPWERSRALSRVCLNPGQKRRHLAGPKVGAKDPGLGCMWGTAKPRVLKFEFAGKKEPMEVWGIRLDDDNNYSTC